MYTIYKTQLEYKLTRKVFLQGVHYNVHTLTVYIGMYIHLQCTLQCTYTYSVHWDVHTLTVYITMYIHLQCTRAL